MEGMILDKQALEMVGFWYINKAKKSENQPKTKEKLKIATELL